ncbi:MAG: DUF4332 domain-containing protein [Cyclobacteriaceae bacterium]
MGYDIDLTRLLTKQYRDLLLVADLLPSRRILQENLKQNFEKITAQGIVNVDGLFKAINTKQKVHVFSQNTNIPEEYLTMLAREIKTYKRKPNRFKDFPELSSDTVVSLEQVGIRNTQQLYDKVLSPASRAQLSSATGLDKDELMKLSKFADLSRIRWVNHTFAYVLYEAGFDTAQKVAEADYNELYERIKELNAARNIYKGNIGLHDMKLCVDAAKQLGQDIEF